MEKFFIQLQALSLYRVPGSFLDPSSPAFFTPGNAASFADLPIYRGYRPLIERGLCGIMRNLDFKGKKKGKHLMPHHTGFGRARYVLRFLSLAVLTALITVPARATEIRDAALKAGLVPHKAIYDIELAGTKSGSQIANISGQMFYEYRPSCEAWISNHRFNLLYEYADSPAMQISSDFSTFEPFDGKSIEFITQRKRDGQLFEELRGRAAIQDDGAGEAVYTSPKGLEFDLPQGALFPMGHTLGVMNTIKEGKKFYKAVIFDGSDEEGPVEVNAFIGKPVSEPTIQKASAGFDPSLLQSSAHKVRMAFFPLSDTSSTSDYEMSIVLHDNGVISDMFIEYDDFSVTQKLVAIEPLQGTCKE